MESTEPPVSPERSRLMAGVRGKNTKPEIMVRRLVHSLGYRFRLHRRDLPGIPDLVFPSRRKIVFVHGCFWHQHQGCRKATIPKTRERFWRAKLLGNVARDKRVAKSLKVMGWKIIAIWECETGDIDSLVRKLRHFLGAKARNLEGHARWMEVQMKVRKP